MASSPASSSSTPSSATVSRPRWPRGSGTSARTTAASRSSPMARAATRWVSRSPAGPASPGWSGRGVGPEDLNRVGRDLVLRGEDGAVGRRHRPLQQRVVGLPHPNIEALAHLRQHLGPGGVGGEVVALLRVEPQVVELLLANPLLPPARLDQQLLGGALVAVSEHRMRVLVKPPYVLPTLGPDGTV